MATSGVGMNQVERRQRDGDDLLPGVLAVIVSCGGSIRKGDLRAREIAQLQQETHRRWCNPPVSPGLPNGKKTGASGAQSGHHGGADDGPLGNDRGVVSPGWAV